MEEWRCTGGPRHPWRLSAGTNEFSPGVGAGTDAKARVAGEEGLSRKGAEPGNASYYIRSPGSPPAAPLQAGRSNIPKGLLAGPGVEHQRIGGDGRRLGLVFTGSWMRAAI